MAINGYQRHAVNVGRTQWDRYYSAGLLSAREYLGGINGYRANRFRIVWARRIGALNIAPATTIGFALIVLGITLSAVFGIDFGGPIR